MPGWQLVVASGQNQARSRAPVACFALGETESLDATIPASGFTAGYAGVVAIEVPGKYRFGTVVEGGTAKVLAFSGDGKRLGESVDAGAPGGMFTDWMELKAAPVTVSVVFTRRAAGVARLRTLWEKQGTGEAGFAPETVPMASVSVPRFAAREAAAADSALRGRVLLGEMGCTSCHDATERGEALVTRRTGPRLGGVGARINPDFLGAWVSDPQAIKPGCGMPGVLTDSPRDASDVEAIAQFLVGLGGPAGSPDAPPDSRVLDDGRALYHTVGCVACHGAMESPAKVFNGAAGLSDALPDTKASQPLGKLAGKWVSRDLAAFLRDPLTWRPGGRMPSMSLTEGESEAIAGYLVAMWGPGERKDQFKPDPAKAAAGRAAFAARGCAACHQLGGAEANIASTLAAKPLAVLRVGEGCLSASDRSSPRYTLDDNQRADLSGGIEAVKKAIDMSAVAPAPLDRGERTMAALDCRACHHRDESGGPSDSLKPYFQTANGTDLGDEGRFPPTLTGVGFKLRTPWLQQVLVRSGKARPYMGMRMPQFGEAHVGALAAQLATMEGVVPDSDAPAPKVTDELMRAGRKLVGESGMNCISCHAFAGKTAGTAGPEMRELVERIRYEWFTGYMLAPSRFKPGTRMTAFFRDGKGAVVDTFGGDPGAQSRALWTYLAAARMAPSPEGLPSGQGMPVAIADRPVVFRTFMKDAGSRGIAVGYPIGIHFGFDATAVRLVDAWQGEFIDATSVWRNRGGEVATGQGKMVWTAPAGPALVLGAKPERWPETAGTQAGHRFRGYTLGRDGTPKFSYQIDSADGAQVLVSERFSPRPRKDVLILREIEIRGLAAGATAWMNAGMGATTLSMSRGGSGQGEKGPDGAMWYQITAGGGDLAFSVEIAP